MKVQRQATFSLMEIREILLEYLDKQGIPVTNSQSPVRILVKNGTQVESACFTDLVVAWDEKN